MTKSTDTSLIEDTEIPAEELVEKLVEIEESEKLEAGDSVVEHATIVEGDDDSATVEVDGEKVSDRRKPVDRRKTNTRRSSDADPMAQFRSKLMALMVMMCRLKTAISSFRTAIRVAASPKP